MLVFLWDEFIVAVDSCGTNTDVWVKGRSNWTPLCLLLCEWSQPGSKPQETLYLIDKVSRQNSTYLWKLK